MAEREVGIIVRIKDLATAAIQGIAKATTGARSVLGSLGSAGSAAFDSIGKAIRTVDHALNVAARGFRIAKMLIGETVGKALEFRAAGDPMLQWFKDAQRESDLVKARIGDIMLPIIKGFATAVGGVGTSMSKWLEQNRKLIASGIVEWVGKLGNLLVSVVARGVLYVTKAWMGVGAAVQLVMLGIARFVEHSVAGAGDIVWAFREVAKAVGADGVAGQLDKALVSVRGLEKGIGNFGDAAQTELELSAAEIVAMENSIVSLEQTAKNLLAKGVSAAMREVANSTAGTTTTIDEQGKAMEDARRREVIWNRERMAAGTAYSRSLATWQESRLAHFAQIEEAQERERRKSEETAQAFAEAAVAMAVAIGAAFGAAMIASNDLNEAAKAAATAMGTYAIQIMQQVVIAAAVKAAAEAYASHQFLPFVGAVVGAAAAATAFSAVTALMSKAKGAAQGMVVTGGIPGRDSVPALLMPNERVLSVRENSAFETLMGSISKHGTSSGGRPVRMASGGVVGRSSGGAGGVTINTSLNLLDAPSSSTQQRRLLLRLSRSLESMVRDGQLRLSPQRLRTV